MRTPEGKVKKLVRDLLARYQGLYTEWPVPSGYGRTTIDCLGCFRGRFFGIETKAPGGKPTPKQDETLRAIAAAGGATFVIDGSLTSLNELKRWLETINKDHPYDPHLPPAPVNRRTL